MRFAPVVGLGLGLVAAATVRLTRYVTDFRFSVLPPIVGIGVLAWATGVLHLDGLADTVDGIACGGDRQRRLDVMRRGDVGPAGVVALVLVLLIQTVALGAAMSAERATEAIVLAAVTGRVAMLFGCRRGIPAARPDGLGALVASSVRSAYAVGCALVLMVQAAAWGAIDNGARAPGAARGAAAVAVGLGAGELVVRRTRRLFGGITGDVLGAVNEVSTMAVILVIAISGASR
jgi:adenosylcobinamide-GDP ribazoletransferase